MTKLLIIGNDKIGRKAISLIDKNNDVQIVLDMSSSLKRVFKLIFKNIISFDVILKMFIAEIFRKNYKINNLKFIKSNNDLLKIIEEIKPKQIILFRAGLIINKTIIQKKIPLHNIHCANVPEYGGLGSINRAIIDKAYYQNACIHRVTTSIDEGEVLKRKPYKLSGKKSYLKNENIAYNTGIELLLKMIN